MWAAARGKCIHIDSFWRGGGIPLAKVLVAEDDTLTRHFLKQALEFGGHEVTTACDGVEAIARVDKPGVYDALVTDYSMPRANGVDVIAHARRIDPMLASIVVTAFRDLDLAMQAMHAGAVAFIPKPCKTDHLNTVLNSALERRELATEAVRLRALTPMLERFTMVLANTIESKDAATQRHANRLVHLSELVAVHIGLARDAVTAVRFGACLHDIGKIAIPEAVLRKPGPLTEKEMEIVRLHPEVGAVMLDGIDTWQDVRQIIRHHHERYDGRGYPDGIAGERIPVGARLVAVVDSFDVMRNGRPYAPPKPYDQVLAELRDERGKQFDPAMVDAFLNVVSDEASNGRLADGPLHPLLGEAVPQERNGVAAIGGWLAGEVGAAQPA